MGSLLVTNRIRKLRFDSGEMTQQALAAKVGVTRQTILTIENGKYCPSLELAFKIAEAFGLRIEDVFIYTGKVSPNSETESKQE